MTLPPPISQPGLVTVLPELTALESTGGEIYYFLNAQDNPGFSGSRPDPSTVKRFITKEEYDELYSRENENIAAQKSILNQQNAVQEQADQAEKDVILEALAEATGLTLEQLKKVL